MADGKDDKTFTKAELDEAIAAAKEAQDAKNAELLGEVKKLKADLRKTQDIKPEDMAALEHDNEKLRADLAAAQKAAKEATANAEKAAKQLEVETGFTHKLLAENGVVAALTAAGVSDPAYLDAAKALHLPAVKVVADGDQRKAMYGDKPLDEAIKEWAAGDVGKKFVAAPANGGGGAPGGKTGEAAKTMLRSAFDALGHAERSAFAKDGGKVVDEAA